MNPEHSEPVVIIAAARSGTKLLRRILSASNEFGGCPYDANYIWKNGNLGLPHDELFPEDLAESQVANIRKFFEKARVRDSADRLIEKTVSNSLRVPAVRKVYPNCKFLHLYRDGYVAASSTLKCWSSPPTSEEMQSRSELLRKLREFPYMSAWPYLAEYAKGYARKYFVGKSHVDYWGPRYKGLREDLERYGVEFVSAKQWMMCVLKSCQSLAELTEGVDYISISFERLVSSSEEEVLRILDFVSAKERSKIMEFARSTIDPEKAKSFPEYGPDNVDPKVHQMIQEGHRALSALMQYEPNHSNSVL